MLQAILAEIRALGNEWRADAKRIKQLSYASEIASTLEGVAAELERLVLHLESGTKYLTVAEYARLHAVTPQSVRTWIRTGQLTVVNGTQGRTRLIRMDSERDKINRGRRNRV
jgi:hypothetical protein